LIASNSATPEGITNGTAIDAYFSALAVPQTTLAATDRLAIRIYVTHSGRTITLHTENSHLCEVITTFSTGLTALTHTFNLPTASAANRGALSSTDWSTFNGKFTLPSLTSGSVLFSNGTTIAQDNANLFWDDTNNRLGIGTNAPTHNLHILGSAGVNTTLKISTPNRPTALTINYSDTGHTGYIDFANVFYITRNSATFPFYISANSNVLINTTTDAGFKLDVNGTARVQGNLSASRLTNYLNNTWIELAGSTGISAGNAAVYLGLRAGNSFTHTTGIRSHVSSNFDYSPTSGTGTIIGLELVPTINQTGGANGITRGIYINPTLTAVADFRAIEVANGITILGAATTAKASLRIPSGTAPTSPVNGDIWFDGTLLKMQIGGVTKTFTII